MISEMVLGFIKFMSMNVTAIIALALVLAAFFVYYEYKMN